MPTVSPSLEPEAGEAAGELLDLVRVLRPGVALLVVLRAHGHVSAFVLDA